MGYNYSFMTRVTEAPPILARKSQAERRFNVCRPVSDEPEIKEGEKTGRMLSTYADRFGRTLSVTTSDGAPLIVFSGENGFLIQLRQKDTISIRTEAQITVKLPERKKTQKRKHLVWSTETTADVSNNGRHHSNKAAISMENGELRVQDGRVRVERANVVTAKGRSPHWLGGASGGEADFDIVACKTLRLDGNTRVQIVADSTRKDHPIKDLIVSGEDNRVGFYPLIKGEYPAEFLFEQKIPPRRETFRRTDGTLSPYDALQATLAAARAEVTEKLHSAATGTAFTEEEHYPDTAGGGKPPEEPPKPPSEHRDRPRRRRPWRRFVAGLATAAVVLTGASLANSKGSPDVPVPSGTHASASGDPKPFGQSVDIRKPSVSTTSPNSGVDSQNNPEAEKKPQPVEITETVEIQGVFVWNVSKERYPKEITPDQYDVALSTILNLVATNNAQGLTEGQAVMLKPEALRLLDEVRKHPEKYGDLAEKIEELMGNNKKGTTVEQVAKKKQELGEGILEDLKRAFTSTEQIDREVPPNEAAAAPAPRKAIVFTEEQERALRVARKAAPYLRNQARGGSFLKGIINS